MNPNALAYECLMLMRMTASGSRNRVAFARVTFSVSAVALALALNAAGCTRPTQNIQPEPQKQAHPGSELAPPDSDPNAAQPVTAPVAQRPPHVTQKGTPAQPQDPDDVREAAFRYMFRKNSSAQQQTAHVFCIELENNAPMPPAFLARFAKVKIPVKPESACDASADNGVTDKSNGKGGLGFNISAITWVDADHADVSGGYYEGGSSASGDTYSLERKNGQWTVIKDVQNWIS